MDTMSRRAGLADSNKRIRHRSKRPRPKNVPQDDGRRLIQLLISLALFLLVYIGRGIFPAQIQVWCEAMRSDVDFTAAFQEFIYAVSKEGSVMESLDELCVRIFGGEPAPDEPISSEDVPQEKLILLSQTAGAGRVYLNSHGVLQGTYPEQGSGNPASSDATPEPSAETIPVSPPPQPALTTATAQAYTDDGVKLPSNVSFAFYELGLPETVAPVSGPVTSTFGYRDSPISGKNEFHLALDIGAEEGTEIGAFADGVVEYIGESDEFGQYLKISHTNQVSSFYAHCSRLLVHKGDIVSCGQTVALVGQTGNATGPHLHLTIEKDNIRLDPAYYVDPA